MVFAWAGTGGKFTSIRLFGISGFLANLRFSFFFYLQLQFLPNGFQKLHKTSAFAGFLFIASAIIYFFTII